MNPGTHIAVNTRLLIDNRLEGIGWFIHEMFSRITAAHPEVTFHFIFDRKFHPKFIYGPNVIPHVIGPQARHPMLFDLWFDYRIPRILRRTGSSLFISPDGFLSRRTKVPQLPVMHDLNFELYPELMPEHIARYYTQRFPIFARSAKRIATVSEFSKKEINRIYHIPLEKIDVVYNGVSEVFRPLAEENAMFVHKDVAHGQPYFVFVGSLHPRKNIHRMLRAFDNFVNTHPEYRMVLVGEPMWSNKEFHTFLNTLNNSEKVILSGRLGRVELAEVVAAASAMVFVPLYEGFGVPVLEAFATEVPLITSNCSSLPEVAGNAAIYADPFDIDNITAAMEKVIDPAISDQLVQKGRIRCEEFSWNRSAALLWKSIEQSVQA